MRWLLVHSSQIELLKVVVLVVKGKNQQKLPWSKAENEPVSDPRVDPWA